MSPCDSTIIGNSISRSNLEPRLIVVTINSRYGNAIRAVALIRKLLGGIIYPISDSSNIIIRWLWHEFLLRKGDFVSQLTGHNAHGIVFSIVGSGKFPGACSTHYHRSLKCCAAITVCAQQIVPEGFLVIVGRTRCNLQIDI